MPRAEFSKKTKREALKRSGGLCEATGALYGLKQGQRCNAPLSGGVEFDHIILAANGGEATLENCAAACPPCHRYKTSKHDTPLAAKTLRQQDKHNGIRRKTAKIKNRGFERKERAPKPSLPPRQIYTEIER